MNAFTLFIERVLVRLSHVHIWAYSGAGGDDAESYWYWHVEQCLGCPKARTVMNGHCACGGSGL